MIIYTCKILNQIYCDFCLHQLFIQYDNKHSVLHIALPDDTIDVYLPQSLTDLKKSVVSLSHYTMHRIDVSTYKSLMMNLSSNVCKKCFIVGHLLTKRWCRADPCYFAFYVDNVRSYHSIRAGVWNLYLCHATLAIVAFQHTNNDMFRKLFWRHKCQPWLPFKMSFYEAKMDYFERKKDTVEGRN